MGTIVDKNTLQAMILEILLKDKELLRGVLQGIAQEYPQMFEDTASTNAPAYVNEPSVLYKKIEKNDAKAASEEMSNEEFKLEHDPNFPVLNDLSLERRQWLEKNINEDFTKYDDVFKALA